MIEIILGYYPPYDTNPGRFKDKGRVFDIHGIAPALIVGGTGGSSSQKPSILMEI